MGSDHPPSDRGKLLSLRPLREPSLQLVDQRITLFHDLILDSENLLTLAALLTLQLLDSSPEWRAVLRASRPDGPDGATL
jgi:hypothetical protein